MICHAVQYSDIMDCSICNLRWDVNDSDPPKCVIGTKPSKREWEVAAVLSEIYKYWNEPKMFNKLMLMHNELKLKDNKMKGEKQKRRCTDANFEKLDAMSFDAYKDPKHLSKAKAEELVDGIPKHIADHYSAMDEDIAGNAGAGNKYVAGPGSCIESVERNRFIMNPSCAPEEWGAKPGSIDATLEERGNRYGDFAEEAKIKCNIKKAMKDSPNWSILSVDKKHALEMVAVKLARILNGDPEYVDNWHDIIGYSKLIENKLLEK